MSPQSIVYPFIYKVKVKMKEKNRGTRKDKETTWKTGIQPTRVKKMRSDTSRRGV